MSTSIGKRSALVLAVAMALIVTLVGAAAAQERQGGTTGEDPGKDGGQGPASATCNGPLGGGSGPGLFSTCISNHGNVVQFNHGLPDGSSFGHLLGREGYYVTLPQDEPGYRCWWDAGTVEFAPWVDISAAPSGSGYKVIRRHDSGWFELEQVFGATTVKKTLKIIMIMKNLTTGTLTGINVGRYADIDAMGISDFNTFLNSTVHSSVLGVFSEFAGTTGSGMMIFPRSYGASPTTAVEAFGDWSDFDPGGTGDPSHSWDKCAPQVPQASPYNGDGVAWANYNLGGIPLGGSKLVVFEYRAM